MSKRAYDTTIDPGCGSIRRDVMSCLGIFLVLLNIVAGALLPSRQADASLSLANRLVLGDRQVICTAAGMVVIGADGTTLPDDGGTMASELCVFCLPLVQGGKAPPTLADLAYPTLTLVPLRFVEAVPVEQLDPARLAFQPRGPPTIPTHFL